MMADKPKTATPYDPFRKYDPAMTPEQYVAKSTSAGSVTWKKLLDPVTSTAASSVLQKHGTTGTGTDGQTNKKKPEV